MVATDSAQAVAKPATSQALLDQVETRMSQALRANPNLILSLGQADAQCAAAYHLQSGGQRVRARLALAGARALGLAEHDAVCIASCVELLHNASLIHDDIQDCDTSRRDQPAVWSKFGSNIAICSGDYLLSAAYGVLCTFTQPLLLPAMLALVHERTGTAIAGQSADLLWRNEHPEGIAHFVQIAKAKSGALLSLPLELVLLAGGQTKAMSLARSACENFAVSYQVLDDLQDATQDCKLNAAAQAPCLNIVHLLSHLHGTCGEPKPDDAKPGDTKPRDAKTAAKDLGLYHLALCQLRLMQMPKGSGALLLDLCVQLRSKLEAAPTATGGV